MTTRTLIVIVFTSFALASCKKDNPKPLASEVNGRLLAGEKGKSKSWRVTDGTFQAGADPVEPFSVNACLLDNIFTFTNNDVQSYNAMEGATKCDPANPDIIESGTWAFTADGKMIIILSNTVPQSSSSFFSYAGFPFPAEVTHLSDAAFQIKMTATKPLGVSMLTTTYIFNFVKA